jgi:hypothetical protein
MVSERACRSGERVQYFKTLYMFSLALLLVGVLGCAPEIGVRLVVPDVPDAVSLEDSTMTANRLRVHVGAFKDNRIDTTLVTIDGRKVESDGSVGSSVQEGFVRYLSRAGASAAVLGAPSIEGAITQWHAEVDPSFPTSRASSVAKLAILIRDSRGHSIYRATFTGESSVENPMLGEKEVSRLLGQAMGSAIEAVVRDEEIMRQLIRGNIQ